MKADLYKVPDGILMPGNYAVQFQFKLKDDIPSSLVYNDSGVRE